MAFLAPLIAAAIPGLGAVGSALVTAALGIGLSFATNKLKAKEKNNQPTGSRVGLKIDTNAPRQMIIGETATGGSLVFWHLSGTNNDKLWMVIALADHECTSLQSVIVSGKLKSWNSGTGGVADYNSKLKVRFKSGAAGQTADSALVAASGGRWTSNEVGTGVCYVVVEADYDETLFPEGIPELGFVVRGAKLLDPRTGTSAYSQNAACAVNTILRGVTVSGEPLLGMNVPAAAIRTSEAQAAANTCDEDVTLGAGGTEDRYRCNCILDCDATNADHIETILASMAGEVIESGGIYRIMAGVAQTAVAHITDDDLISGEPLPWRPKRGRNALVNAVQGSYFDPARLYSAVGLPPRTSSTDETTDGGRRYPVTIDLQAVTSRTQAQRVLEIERRKARRMGTLTATLRARWFVLEPGDWITYTSARRGFTTKTFVLESSSGARDLVSNIAFSEIDAEFDDWSTALEIADDQVIDLPPAGPTLTTVSGLSLTNITLPGAGSQQRPGLRINWTAITDPTVVSLSMEFRKVGDTVAIERSIAFPSAATYSWADTVQGGVTYEARLRPVTRPERTTTWSSWVSSGSNGVAQVVGVAESANAVPDDTITPEMLSEQARFELSLSTAAAEIQGSVQERVVAFREQLEAFAAAQLEHRRATGETRSRVLVTERTIQTQTESFAAYTAQTDAALAGKASASALSGLEARVTVTETGVTAATARAYLAINVTGPNGVVTGGIDLYGNSLFSIITLLADKFVVARPDGTGAKQIITTGLINGVSEVGINGNLFIDGTIVARHISVATLSALTANIGTVTAGRVQNSANTTYLDLNTSDFQLG